MGKVVSRLIESFAAACMLLFIVLFPGTASGREQLIKGIAEVNGTRLSYEMMGRGKTVVLIHGGLVDSRMWDDQFRPLAKRHRVIRYDLRGFGKSDFPTGSYSNVEDLYALLKFLKVEKASLGGMIATDFALEHPQMVESLILTSFALRGYQSPRNEKTISDRSRVFGSEIIALKMESSYRPRLDRSAGHASSSKS